MVSFLLSQLDCCSSILTVCCEGIHLAPAGYRIVFDELVKVLRDNWPEYPPYTMIPKVLVQWETELHATAAAADAAKDGPQ